MEREGCFGGLPEHDSVKVRFGVRQAQAKIAWAGVIPENLVDYGDIQFGSVGGAIKDGVAGFRYINREMVGATVLNSGIDGLANASRGGGKITNIRD